MVNISHMDLMGYRDSNPLLWSQYPMVGHFLGEKRSPNHHSDHFPFKGPAQNLQFFAPNLIGKQKPTPPWCPGPTNNNAQFLEHVIGDKVHATLFMNFRQSWEEKSFQQANNPQRFMDIVPYKPMSHINVVNMYPCMYTVYMFFDVCIYYIILSSLSRSIQKTGRIGEALISLICQYSSIHDRLELNPENSCNICNVSYHKTQLKQCRHGDIDKHMYCNCIATWDNLAMYNVERDYNPSWNNFSHVYVVYHQSTNYP